MIDLDRLREVERVTSEMLEIGGDDLRRRWGFVAATMALARQALDEPENRREIVDMIKFNIDSNYGGYGSFNDWNPSGPGYRRFLELRDELSGLVAGL